MPRFADRVFSLVGAVGVPISRPLRRPVAVRRAPEWGGRSVCQRSAKSTTTPANTAKPTQWLSRKARKQPSRVRVRISV